MSYTMSSLFQASPSCLLIGSSHIPPIPSSLITSAHLQAHRLSRMQTASLITITSHMHAHPITSLKASHLQQTNQSSRRTINTICAIVRAPYDGIVDGIKLVTCSHDADRRLPSLANSLYWLTSSPCVAAAQLASTFCNALDYLISTIHSSTTVHNAQFLQGNFTPVADECPPQACSFDEHYGPLPSFLEGLYVRNGPNEQFKSRSAPTQASHPFDGDGMLHSVSFHGGKATYCCRFVRTSRFVQEKAAGQVLFPKIFSTLTIKDSFVATAHMSLAVLRHVLGLVDLSKGMGLANTGLIFHHGKLLALGEDDLPYTLSIGTNGDLTNTGRYSFSGNGRQILPKTMTSHPKIDPVTGEMILLSYNAFFRPYLTFFRVSQDGTLSKPVPIALEEPCMIHDFAITAHYIIFPETQLVVHPLHMVQGKAPIMCDAHKVQRFGVMPRDATDDSEVRWFDVPGCNCFHIFNSWEEEKEEEEEEEEEQQQQQQQQDMIYSSKQRKSSAKSHGNVEEIVLILPNLSSPDDLLSGKFEKVGSILTEVRLNLAKGEATQRALLGDHQLQKSKPLDVEMGTMNESYRGAKNRYVYMGVLGSSSLNNLSGLVKVDIKTHKVVACRMFDDNCFASEPKFVPRFPPHAYMNSKLGLEEDEGCLLCFFHRERPNDGGGGAADRDSDSTDASDSDSSYDDACRMLVLDAKSPTLDIIASIKLPRRIPYGFHGLFVPKSSYNLHPSDLSF